MRGCHGPRESGVLLTPSPNRTVIPSLLALTSHPILLRHLSLSSFCLCGLTGNLSSRNRLTKFRLFGEGWEERTRTNGLSKRRAWEPRGCLRLRLNTCVYLGQVSQVSGKASQVSSQVSSKALFPSPRPVCLTLIQRQMFVSPNSESPSWFGRQENNHCPKGNDGLG